MKASEEILWKMYDAIRFITRTMALPKRVMVEAAEAALKVIQNYYKETKNEKNEMD